MKWSIKDKIKKNTNYDEVVTQLLKNRGLEDKASVEKFLHPKLTDLHDPFLIPDMDKAVDRVLQARKNNEKIVIYGDYDADGVTATSTLWLFLYRELGIDVMPYIPSRADEGYGLNEQAVEELESKGVNLIITVDCGIKDAELIKKFPNIDFIVTDHHTLPEDQNFEHIAVHPAREGSKYPFHSLAGAGVAWKLVCALSQKLNKAENTNYDPYKYLEIAAIGTVSDIMPLIDENRIIVKYGLEQMKDSGRVGLVKLLELIGKADKELDTYDIGFGIGPRINAAGRLENALDAVRLFATEDESKAFEMAQYLDDLNKQRQVTTQEILEDAMAQVDESKQVLIVHAKDWHEGIIGLVAGKLKEKYYKPAICATEIDGVITASARSIKGINITEAIGAHEESLLRFGGHAQAAGFSLEGDNFAKFRNSLEKYIAENFEEELFEREIKIDMELLPEFLTLDFYEALFHLAPFGEANSEPVLLMKEMEVVRKFLLGKEQKHIKFMLKDQKGGVHEAIGFSMADRLSKFDIHDKLDVVFKLSKNTWNGNTNLQLILIDAKNS